MASAPAPVFARPSPLAAGGMVHAVAPAGAYADASLIDGLAVIEQAGFAVTPPVLCPPHFGYAGTDAQRLAALRRALETEAGETLWAVRGGSGTGRILVPAKGDVAHTLKQKPRWLIGFSDITALHARWQAAGIMSLHAANLSNLARWGNAQRGELFALLGDAPPTLSYQGAPMLMGHADRPVRGPVVGGNLTVLASLAGTGLLPSWQGCIVLLEDVGERPYRLDRCLAQLIGAGQLAHIAGVAVGQLTHCGEAHAPYHATDMLAATLAPLGIPAIAELPIGHDTSSRPIVLGAEAHLDARQGLLTVTP